jgi:methylthioribose-1-phosphate isomerase
MKRRQVDAGKIPIVSYGTAKEAISVQSQHDLQSKARFATESLSGSRIESYQLSDDHIFLSLSNGRVMHLFVQDHNIGWSIHEAQDVMC